MLQWGWKMRPEESVARQVTWRQQRWVHLPHRERCSTTILLA